MSYASWFVNLPIPWLVAGPVGQKYWQSIGSVFDDQIDQFRQAVKARFPTKAPSDALQYIGNDRLLVRGAQETDANYIKRLLDAWSQWKTGGTAAGLLSALYFAGFGTNVVTAQQNGLAFSIDSTNIYDDLGNISQHAVQTPLSENPRQIIGAANDITVTITTGGIVGTARYSLAMNGVTFATNVLTSLAWTPVGLNDYAPLTRLAFLAGTYVLATTYTISQRGIVTPGVGAFDGLRQNSAPWFFFDLNDYFCSRFAILITDGGSGPFTTYGTARFTGTEDGTLANPWPVATWNVPFDDTNYTMLEGIPIVIGGGPPVVCTPDSTTKSKTGISVAASAPFTGTVSLIAYVPGSNPYSGIRAADLARLRLVIRLWRPAKATCMGVYVLVQGKFIGYPPRRIGDTSLGTTIGPSTVVYYSPT